jgi:hypothetical protein
VQSQLVIDAISSAYFRYSQIELFKKWITAEIYTESRKSKKGLFVGLE